MGSRESLRPSPSILNPNTTIIVARPGAKESMGCVRRYLYPSFIMLPQAQVGGTMPIPRKLRAASSPEEAAEAYRLFTSAVDRAVKKGVYHDKTASRMKSRLSKHVKPSE